MPAFPYTLPEGPADPCPHGCGRTTDDEAGGPCSACWEAVRSAEREEHCGNDCGGRLDEETGEYDEPEDCVCCECCCECLGCIYAPRDSTPLTDAQRAPIAAFRSGDQ